MANIWLSSDPHLHHENLVLKFKRQDGSPLRSFSTVEEHDEYLIEQHNKVVRSQDHWYCGGDVVMDRRYLHLIERFNGHRRLIRGNHDIFRTKFYMQYFDEIYATRVLDNILFSHIPVHPMNLGKFLCNAHGHVHQNSLQDVRYYNLSMENLTDYTPLSLEELKKIVKKRQEEIQDLDSGENK